MTTAIEKFVRQYRINAVDSPPLETGRGRAAALFLIRSFILTPGWTSPFRQIPRSTPDELHQLPASSVAISPSIRCNASFKGTCER